MKVEEMKKRIIKENFLDNQPTGGLFFEVSFVIKKFLELPEEQKKELYAQINSEELEVRSKVAHFLFDLVRNNPEELAKFATKDESADLYLILGGHEEKATYIFTYFFIHLKENLSIEVPACTD